MRIIPIIKLLNHKFMKFYLTTVSRISRWGETVTSSDGFFDTENAEILSVARAMWAKFEETKEEVTPKKKNAKI